VRLVAERCSIDDDLGIKGGKGVLETMATRKKFLEDPDHRIRFVYTPRHASWLNQVEIWFSILARRALKRASFVSLAALEKRLTDFIDYFNAVLAKPFRWTYAGKPLQTS
jgi:transposase